MSKFTTFPLYPIVHGKCGCSKDCGTPGKHPAVKWSELEPGQQMAPYGDGGLGVVTGRKSGIFVVDCDVKPGANGLANLEALGVLPDTLIVSTPSGGYHLYFNLPDFHVSNSVSKLAPEVDIRGEGGYVVAAHSPHKNGGTYQVALEAPIVDAPEWLVQWLRADAAASLSTPAGGIQVNPISPEHPDWARRMGLAQEYLQKAEPCTSGNGGHATLWKVACELTRRLELPLDVCAQLLVPYNARCQPPWDENDVVRKLDQASTRGNSPTGIAPENWVLKTPGMKEIRTDNLRGACTATEPREAGYTFRPAEDQYLGGKRSKISLEDIALAINKHPDWARVWRFDEFRRQIWAINPPMALDAERGLISNSDITNICLWFECQGFLAFREHVVSVIEVIAKQNAFHPVREYLAGLPAVPSDYLETAATRIFGSTDVISNEMFKRFLVAAVRRVMEPGAKVDTILILYGKQGYRKSSFVSHLFGKWFRDQMPELSNRDASHALQGYWGIELGELDKLQRLETTTIKDFLSRCVDKYREFGTKEVVESPRQSVFIGTTNDERFLRDATGNRRYWPIIVNKKIQDFDRDSLWAAAFALYQEGYSHWFTEDDNAELEGARAMFIDQDSWQDSIETYLAGKKWVTTDEVYGSVVMKVADRDSRGRNRIYGILRQIGCHNSMNQQKRQWKVPEKYANMGPKMPGSLN